MGNQVTTLCHGLSFIRTEWQLSEKKKQQHLGFSDCPYVPKRSQGQRLPSQPKKYQVDQISEVRDFRTFGHSVHARSIRSLNPDWIRITQKCCAYAPKIRCGQSSRSWCWLKEKRALGRRLYMTCQFFKILKMSRNKEIPQLTISWRTRLHHWYYISKILAKWYL